MGDEKATELLLQILQDMSFVKAKLESIDEQKISSRLDDLEASAKENARVIEKLEKETDKTEDFIRNSLVNSRHQQATIFVSLGVAVFSAILSFIFGLLK